MTPLERLLEKLPGARATGNGWCARCPAHEDRKPSLSISEGEDGRALIHCHAGCAPEAVCAAVGLSLRDLMPERNDPQLVFRSGGQPEPQEGRFATANDAVLELEGRHGMRSALWTYHDTNGNPVGLVVRWDRANGAKDIRPVSRHDDGWRIGAMPGPRPLYGLPDLAAAKCVLVVEGEKCADAARALGFTVTASVGGAQAPGKTDWSPLAGKEVWLLPDNDAPGRKYAVTVEKELTALARPVTVKVLDPATAFGRADPPSGYDIADALAECVTDDDRRALCERVTRAADAAPRPQPHRARTRAAPDLLCFADVTPTEVRWLWRGRIPLGRISLLCGRPGAGKSFVTCDAAARISTGADWPDGGASPLGDTLLICAEDDPADTIAPRLLAAGADLRRVHLLRAVTVRRPDGEEASVAFDLANVDLVRDALDRLPACRLVVLDPIGSYLGGTVDAHRDNEVRNVLAPLGLLAADRGVAVLLVAHARKAAADFADDTVLGSRAFTGLARSVLHVASDPEDRARRFLLPGKCNLSEPAPGLAYRISANPARVEWEPAPLDVHADDLMPKAGRPPSGRSPRSPEPKKRDAAAEWLADVLAGGAMSVPDLQQQAEEAGLSWSTVRRAQRALNIKPQKAKFSGGWQWQLPNQGARPAGTSRRCPSGAEGERLRESADEPNEEPVPNPEGAQVASTLSTFGASPEGAPEACGNQLFQNPTTNLPD